MYAGGSAREKAASLRVEAAALREQAELKAQEATHWDKGADGEARVGRELAGLEASGWTALHDRLAAPEESKANLDHLLVGPGGVVLIDSKNWASGAWVYEGMLFRNGPSGSAACRDELAHVRYDAAAVSDRIAGPVLPILCLSGPRAGKITAPVEVDGVHVMGIGQLLAFLRNLPANTSPAEVLEVVGRLEQAFPSACASPPPVLAAPSAERPTRVRRMPTGTRRGAGLSRPSGLRALLAIGGILLLVTVGPRALSALGNAAGHALTRAMPKPSAAAPFPAPCAGITDAQVAGAVGRRVYRFNKAGTDTCRWGYAPPPATYYPADVEIQTGWSVKFAADAAHGRVQVTHSATSEQLLVPQFVAVPGSTLPASTTTQPLAVAVNISRQVPRASAARAARRLAQLIETHMPTGPGATSVSAVR